MPIEVRPDTSGKTPAPADPAMRMVTYEGPIGSRRASFGASFPVELRNHDAVAMRRGSGLSVEATIAEGDVNSYRIAFTSENASEREGWKVAAKVATTMTSTPTHFVVEERIEAWHNGERIHEARWKHRIRRDGN